MRVVRWHIDVRPVSLLTSHCQDSDASRFKRISSTARAVDGGSSSIVERYDVVLILWVDGEVQRVEANEGYFAAVRRQ